MEVQMDQILSLVLIFILTVVAIRHFWMLYRLPPGPYGLPLLGYSVFIDPKEPYKTFDELRKKYGKIFSLQIGSVRVVCLTDYNLIKTAFAKDNFSGRPPLPITHGIMEGYGIIGAEGPWWAEQRRFFTDSLRHLGVQKSYLKNSKMEERILNEVKLCLEELDKHSDGVPFDCQEILARTFGNVVCQLIFGQRFPTDHEKFRRQLELLNKGTKMVNVMGTLNFFPFLRFVPCFRRAYMKLLKSKDEHHDFLREQIDEHKETLDEENPRDYLDLFLVEMKKKTSKSASFVDKQLIHALADFFGSGIETSKVTFQWLLLYLMTHLDIQDKVRREIEQVVGKEREIRLSDAASLPYVEAVVLETHRLANLIPLGAPHGTLKDSEFEGYLIPSGTMVMGLLWCIHMNPDLWPEPEVFNPERFLDEEGKIKKVDCYMPFSAGRRMCPGEDMAKMEIFLLLTTLVRKFLILPPEDQSPNLEPQMGFTLTPLPFQIRFIPVNPED